MLACEVYNELGAMSLLTLVSGDSQRHGGNRKYLEAEHGGCSGNVRGIENGMVVALELEICSGWIDAAAEITGWCWWL